MRKEWEAAREHREKAELDAAVNFRGQYVFRVDATGEEKLIYFVSNAKHFSSLSFIMEHLL